MAKLVLPKQDNKSGISVDFGEGKSLSPLSLLPIPIMQKRNGEIIGYGTAFLARQGKDAPTLLVTNYHVLTARYPANPSLMLPHYPDSPDELEFRIPQYKNNMLLFSPGSIQNVSNNDFQFIEHRDRAKGVDLAALKIQFPPDAILLHVDQLPLSDSLELEVGGDVFILGFPFPPKQETDFPTTFPTWKRASIASEPSFPIDGLSKIHVDSASRPGMSGSPVFLRAMVDKVWLTKEEAKLHQSVDEGKATALDFIRAVDPAHMAPKRVSEYRFIGIYAGRYGIPAEDESSIRYRLVCRSLARNVCGSRNCVPSISCGCIARCELLLPRSPRRKAGMPDADDVRILSTQATRISEVEGRRAGFSGI